MTNNVPQSEFEFERKRRGKGDGRAKQGEKTEGGR
jgi:hypothetical protein